MRIRKPLLVLFALAAIAVSALYAYRYRHAPQRDNLAVLSYLPGDPSAVIYVDVAALRQSAFLAQLAAWAPQPQKDPDYAQFVQDTGFNFERDLDHLAIATTKLGADATFLIGEGRFDRKRISAYAQSKGHVQQVSGHDIFEIIIDSPVISQLTFLSDSIVLFASRAPTEEIVAVAARKSNAGSEWRERFHRLAGSPVFAVIRQDAAASLAGRAPGGFRSPQLSSLLAQLQWITIAAKPDADQLRLVAEGESASDATSRQLADMLNGVLILAQAGLSDPKLRKQLAPDVRQAYVELLKGADISKLDRGETKSVRLVLSITPQFLEAASHYSLFYTPSAAIAAPGAGKPPADRPASRRGAPRKSGT